MIGSAGLGRAGAGCRIGTWTHSNRWAHKAHNVACRAGEGWGRLQDRDLNLQSAHLWAHKAGVLTCKYVA